MRALPVLIASAALVASACSPNGDITTTGSTGPTGSTGLGGEPADVGDRPTTTSRGDRVVGGTGRFPQSLTPFADCSAFLDHVKAEARERVGPYGLQNDPWFWFGEGGMRLEATEEMAIEDSAGAAGDAGAPAATVATTQSNEAGDDGGTAGDPDFTGTNVQELGVDEPDIIKTDGRRIIAVSENRLSYIDVTGEPVLTDAIQIPEGWGHELFIRGDRALLFTNGGQWGRPMPVDVIVDDAAVGDAEAEFAEPPPALDMIAPEQYGPATVVIDVDLSDPNSLRIAASMRIEGQYLSARAIGEKVRLAVTSPPTQLPWLYPQNQNGEERATEANRDVIERSSLDDWLPSYELQVGDRTTGGPLVSCDRAHHPADFSGFDVISIVDLDLADGLADSLESDRASAVALLAGGQTVYSSTDRMYVATTEWVVPELIGDGDAIVEWNEEFTTEIHAFAISTDEPTRYVASGALGGSLLNQFSLDEHEGFLRAITTDGSPWGRDGNTSETHLVVFEEQGDRLVAVGEVGGLGRGEQLHSARLIGDRGYAVTFRQIDPFYVLDLSDPRNPRVTGELKIPGVSTYLHPVGEHHVVGVGQDATEDGRTTGLKLSLFDVSDPTDPREVDVWTIPNANSPVEWDHRAFQMIGTMAIVPAQGWNQDFNGAILFDIGDRISEIGRVTHVDRGQPSSDCRTITLDEVPEDTEFWWIINDGAGRVQLCDADDVGGWGSWYCDPIPLADLQYWFGDARQADATIEALGADRDDRIEMCWPDGYQESIQRSLVIGDTLWTMTPRALQANRLDGLDVIATIGLR